MRATDRPSCTPGSRRCGSTASAPERKPSKAAAKSRRAATTAAKRAYMASLLAAAAVVPVRHSAPLDLVAHSGEEQRLLCALGPNSRARVAGVLFARELSRRVDPTLHAAYRALRVDAYVDVVILDTAFEADGHTYHESLIHGRGVVLHVPETGYVTVRYDQIGAYTIPEKLRAYQATFELPATDRYVLRALRVMGAGRRWGPWSACAGHVKTEPAWED